MYVHHHFIILFVSKWLDLQLMKPSTEVVKLCSDRRQCNGNVLCYVCWSLTDCSWLTRYVPFCISAKDNIFSIQSTICFA